MIFQHLVTKYAPNQSLGIPIKNVMNLAIKSGNHYFRFFTWRLLVFFYCSSSVLVRPDSVYILNEHLQLVTSTSLRWVSYAKYMCLEIYWISTEFCLLPWPKMVFYGVKSDLLCPSNKQYRKKCC